MKAKIKRHPVAFLIFLAAFWLGLELFAARWSGPERPVRIHAIDTAVAQEAGGGASSNRSRTPPIHFPDFPIEEGRMRLFHVALVVSDLDKSVDFYTNTLGFRVIRYQNIFPYRAAFIWTGDGEPIIELMQALPEAENARPVGFGHLGLFIDDVDRIYEETIAAGHKWRSEPGRPGPGAPYMGFIKDPDGNEVEIMENPKRGCTSCHRGPHLK